jgi:hypothetical protein
LKQIYIPNGDGEIVSKFQADLAASNAKFNASLISLFDPKAAAAPQPVAPVTSITFGKRANPAGLVLPKHRIGEFRDRLAVPLRVVEA